MPTYVIFLLSALGIGTLCFRSHRPHELLLVLAALGGLTCLIAGLTLAPWQVQLTLVVAALLASRFYLRAPSVE